MDIYEEMKAPFQEHPRRVLNTQYRLSQIKKRRQAGQYDVTTNSLKYDFEVITTNETAHGRELLSGTTMPPHKWGSRMVYTFVRSYGEPVRLHCAIALILAPWRKASGKVTFSTPAVHVK
jgi:hypothetical protein